MTQMLKSELSASIQVSVLWPELAEETVGGKFCSDLSGIFSKGFLAGVDASGSWIPIGDLGL